MSQRRPTITDVARAAGVSKGAVSFALNDRPGVAAGTRERILAAVDDLGFTPSHRGRALSTSRALAVGLVIARPPETLRFDPFFPAFIAGIETVLSACGQALVLQVVADEASERASYRRLAADGRVDGIFLTDLRIEDPRPALLAELDLPTVIIGPTSSPGPWPSVTVDDQPGIAAVVRHLVGLGHRDIAHVAGPAHLVHGASRRTAWRGALAAAGLPQGQCVHADFSARGGAAATTALLDSDEPPTAIVYANDLMAIAGMSTAIGRGLDVPSQLSVTGFDDTEVAAHLQPGLTTVRTDVASWGQAAAARLLHLLDDQPSTNVDLPPPHLMVRGSTAQPRPTRQPPHTHGRRHLAPPRTRSEQYR